MSDYDLRNNALKLGIKLTENQIEKFNWYYTVLIEQNRVMNLTSITDYNDVMLKHFIDSMAVNVCIQKYPELNLNNKCKVMDIGTGAGFPGIPLKIIFDNLEVTLLDSLNKRIMFLDKVINGLTLNGMETLHGRAEDYAQLSDYRENYNLCVSRAVSNLTILSEYCIPYVKIGGFFISYKSGSINEEVENAKKAIHVLGGELVDVIKVILPESDIERSFVIIKKIKKTPIRYPRKAGIPSREPIV